MKGTSLQKTFMALVTALVSGGILSAVVSFVLPKLWPDNKPPVAEIRASSTSGHAPLEVLFDGTASHDPDGRITTYIWKINDKILSKEVSFTYKFVDVAKNHVTLTVKNSKGLEHTNSTIIDVQQPVSALSSISSPPPPDRTKCDRRKILQRSTEYFQLDMTFAVEIDDITDNRIKKLFVLEIIPSSTPNVIRRMENLERDATINFSTEGRNYHLTVEDIHDSFGNDFAMIKLCRESS